MGAPKEAQRAWRERHGEWFTCAQKWAHSFRGINPLRGGDSCWNWISFWGTILLHNFETNWETHTSILLHPLNTGEKTSGFQMNPLICFLVWRCGIMKGFCFFFKKTFLDVVTAERYLRPKDTNDMTYSPEVETSLYKWTPQNSNSKTWIVPNIPWSVHVRFKASDKKNTVQYGQWPSQHTPLEGVDAMLFPSLHPRRPPDVANLT